MEWEYAARAGTKDKYWWGSQPPVCEKGRRNGAKFDDDKECNDTGTEAVSSYQPNPRGLYDVHGNVWEWTCSIYENPYGEKARGCQQESESGTRVLRGGSWFYRPENLRAAERNDREPGGRNNLVGFRLAQDL